MEHITKAMDILQIPNFFRDVIVVCGGLVSIFFLLWLKPEVGLYQTSELISLGRFEEDFLVLVTAFFFGKLLIVIADFIEDIIREFVKLVLFVSEKDFLSRIISTCKEWKINWRESLIGYVDARTGRSVDKTRIADQISIIDIAGALRQNPSLAANLERIIYSILVVEVVATTTLIAGIFSSWYWLLVSLALFVLNFRIYRKKADLEYRIYAGVIKNEYKK